MGKPAEPSVPRPGRSAGTNKSSFESGSDALSSRLRASPLAFPCSLRGGHSLTRTGRGQTPFLAACRLWLLELGGNGGGLGQPGEPGDRWAGLVEAAGKWQTKLLFCEKRCRMSDRKAVEGKPVGKVNVKSEAR